jgi:hypothetical protein
MHYNGTEINTNIQYQYLHAHYNQGKNWSKCKKISVHSDILNENINTL